MNNDLLVFQVRVLTLFCALRSAAHDRIERLRDDERGEVTATTALIVLLVAAAVVAGGVIANKIKSNADSIPSP